MKAARSYPGEKELSKAFKAGTKSKKTLGSINISSPAPKSGREEIEAELGRQVLDAMLESGLRGDLGYSITITQRSPEKK
jgi:hypothetical protein